MLKTTGKGIFFDWQNEDTKDLPIIQFSSPSRLLVPLCTAKTDVMELRSAPGDVLSKSDLLAVSEDGEKFVFSPVSGIFESVEKRRRPGIGLIPCASIRVDNNQPFAKHTTPFKQQAFSSVQIIEAAKNAAIIDEYDAQPLYLKLSHAKGYISIAAEALDDQPYMSANVSVLRDFGEEAAKGLRFAAEAISADMDRCFFATAGNLPKGIFKSDYLGFPVRDFSGTYPASARLCEEKRLVIGVQALVALYRAISCGTIQSRCVVAIGGDCIEKPQNFEVTIGTQVSDLLEFMNVTGEINRIVCGGPMTGKIISPNAPITPDMRTIIVMREVYEQKSAKCIGCGACISVCPKNILPLYIMQATQNRKFGRDIDLGASRCTGCGCCSYVCPAGIDVSAAMKSLQTRKEGITHEH